MNLPNRLTLSRIIIAILIIIILLFPFDTMSLSLPKLFVNESLVIDTKYIITGFLFLIAAITDILDGYFARKLNASTDIGKTLDLVADKILVDSVLIILVAYGFVHPIVTVVIIIRDLVVDTFKIVSSDKGRTIKTAKTEKIKSFLLMTGIILTLFYNLPFELWNLRLSDVILLIAAVLSVVSGIEYYDNYKECLK